MRILLCWVSFPMKQMSTSSERLSCKLILLRRSCILCEQLNISMMSRWNSIMSSTREYWELLHNERLDFSSNRVVMMVFYLSRGKFLKWFNDGNAYYIALDQKKILRVKRLCVVIPDDRPLLMLVLDSVELLGWEVRPWMKRSSKWMALIKVIPLIIQWVRPEGRKMTSLIIP